MSSNHKFDTEPEHNKDGSCYICNHLADEVLFEAYPYLSVNGLMLERDEMKKERIMRGWK